MNTLEIGYTCSIIVTIFLVLITKKPNISLLIMISLFIILLIMSFFNTGGHSHADVFPPLVVETTLIIPHLIIYLLSRFIYKNHKIINNDDK
jgi:hypothetical protein